MEAWMATQGLRALVLGGFRILVGRNHQVSGHSGANAVFLSASEHLLRGYGIHSKNPSEVTDLVIREAVRRSGYPDALLRKDDTNEP